jgi:hypothetical protein
MVVVLGDRDTDPRDLVLLVAIHDPQIDRPGQVMPAVTPALREPFPPMRGVIDPGEVRPRRPGLLALGRFGPFPPRLVRAGGVLPGPSSRDGGDEELPEFRERRCSSPASLRDNRSLAPARSATSAAIALICPSCRVTNAINSSRDSSSGAGTS